MIEMNETILTSGTGYWSSVIKPVNCTGYKIAYVNEECDFGELRVYFDSAWNVEEDGLIYTDEAFLTSIRFFFGTNDIDYSEQGMQGNKFVSFDIGREFLMKYDWQAQDEFL